MICIHKGKQFKFLAEQYNVSEDKLAQIIYKYYEESGSQDNFPSETYIKAQLGYGSYVEPSNILREGWKKLYSKEQVFKNNAKLKEAQAQAEKLYPGHVFVYENNKKEHVLRVEKPVKRLPIERRKDFTSWAEYNDYLIVMGDKVPASKRDREQQIIGQQPFTFKDGTTIRVPFKPNTQQEEALNAMSDFINSNETSMTLSGYAGTGKTSLMEMIAAKMKKEGKKIVFSASTNKAASVLKNRVSKAGFDASTLNKVFGIQVEVDNTKPYDAANLINKLKEAEIESGTVVVIDEASMINEENYRILNGIAKDNGLKIIYVGDKGQLAPVKETQISKVFRDNNGRIVTLTQVERTGDNAILEEATNLRNGKSLSGESSFNTEGKGVAYIKPTNKQGIKDIVEAFVPMLRTNPDYFRILAYTNAKVTAYNDAVRNALGYTDTTPRVGEPIVGYTNWGAEYNRRTRRTEYRFINSESYKVTKVEQPTTVEYYIDGNKYSMLATPIVIEDAMGNRQSINLIDIKTNESNKEAATRLAEEKARLFDVAKKLPRTEQPAVYQQINDIEKFLFVNDSIKKDKRTLQAKVFDFGYAMTVHKSQGSTFNNVLIDDTDIAKAETGRNNAFFSDVDLDFIDSFDPTKAEVQEISEVDLGLDNYISEPKLDAVSINKAENNVANARQQLEYVAVSRATDTVTIISNNVKTEDTPLNHTKQSTPSTTATTENTAKPIQQMNSRELWQYVGDFATPMGERLITYTPKGKTKQQYIVKGDKVYNKEGKEVHYQGKDINRILANLAVAEDRGVVVTYRDKDYVVDNHQNITSVQTGDIMKWGAENGDRKAIIQLAEQKFKTLIENRQNRLSEMVPELMDLLKAQGINIHDKAAMEKFLKENPQWSTKVQQAIEENREMQSIKERTIADGTFMKAPNGKPTKLTERQWLQVRTKAFKDWFGDWINDPKNASKVIDENGEPLVVYHGSPSEFTQFDKDLLGSNTGANSAKLGFFFSKTYEASRSYIGDVGIGEDNLGYYSVIPELEQLQNEIYSELDILDNEYQYNMISKEEYDSSKAKLQQALKDGTDKIYEKIRSSNKKVKGNFLNIRNLASYTDTDSNNITQKITDAISKKADGVLLLEVKDPTTTDDYIVFEPNQIKSATDNNGMFSTENDDIQMAIDNKKSLQALNTVDEAIKTGNWTNEASDELDNLTEIYNNGRNEITKILGRSLSETSRSSEAYAAASIILERVHNSMRGSNDFRSALEEFTARNRERRLKENAVQQWAQKNGWWWNDYSDNAFLDDYLVNEYGEGVAGSESMVHLSKNGKYVIKATSAIASEGDLIPLMHKIELHNQIFTSTPIEVIGFGRTKDGNFRVIAQQPTITGKKISAREATKFLTSQLGAKNNQKEHSQILFGGKVILKDITNPKNRGNILKDAEGNYFVIDADITFSKEALKEIENLNAINDTTQFMQTPEGEIYGFADPKGDLYFDEDNVSPNVQIHEYTHLWDRAVAQRNPKLWQRGITLMRQTSLWDEILNDPNYGQRWKALKSMTDDKLESLIASEVHSRLVGTQGEALLNRIAKEQGSKGIVAKLKQWILDFWKELKATFSNWSDEEINNLTLDDFNKMTVRDLVDKVNLKEQQIPQQQNTINQQNNRSNNKIEYGNDFRRIQETVRKGSQGSSVSGRDIPINRRQDLANVLRRELGSIDSFAHGSSRNVSNQKHGTSFVLHTEVDPQLFHDFFEAVRYYTDNGELVDLHDDYTDCKCFLTEDGTAGFAIEPDGNLISVFNLGTTKGFLSAVKETILEAGATHLDAFASSNQNLRLMYEKLLGAKVASSMDYNMEFDHDNIAANHGNPQVVFMVMGEAAKSNVEERHFNKNQYDEAQAYQLSFVQQPISKGSTYVSRPIQMENLGRETGERVIQADKAWKEERLKYLDRDLGQAIETDNEEWKEDIFNEIQKVQNAVDKVELPNYEYINDLYEDTLVDAEWKIPLLKSLDDQIRERLIADDYQQGEEMDIIREMDRILNATSEAEYNAASTKEEEVVNKKMADRKRLNQQRRNLINNEVGLLPTEIRETAEGIVDDISDIITDLQQNPNKVKEYFPTISVKEDLSKASRRKIIEVVGINRLINLAKDRFEKLRRGEDGKVAGEYAKSFDIIFQANLILENWDAVLEYASDVFVANEMIGISRNHIEGNYEASQTEYTGYDYDAYADPQDEETIEAEGDGQEHWQVESRTIDVINSMSELVRMALHECYLLDRNGNKILSKFGVPLRVDKKRAVDQILKWSEGTMNINQMIEKISAQRTTHPWVNQLLQRLNDTSGNNADFQSQFFGVMHRHRQSYNKGQYEKGHFRTMPLNSHEALAKVMNSLNAQFRLNELPLFGETGINQSNFKLFRGYYAELQELVNDYGIKDVNGSITAVKELDEDDVEKAANTLQGISRMLGFPVSAEDLIVLISPELLHTSVNQTRYIVNALLAQSEKSYAGYDPFKFKGDNNIRSSVQNFLKPIVDELDDSITNSFFEDGKMYQSYVIPSFLTQLFDQFNQSEESFHTWVESFYGYSQWFKKGGQWRNPWLKILTRKDSLGSKAREIFSHHVQLNFNRHSYMRNMTPEEYALSVWMEYFSEKTNTKDPEHSTTWFNVPIMSNKPSSEFIRFFADKSSNYKKNITNQMYDFFLQELDRIDTVRKRERSKATAISSFDEQGRTFLFLPFLNGYLVDNGQRVDKEGGNLLKTADGEIDAERNTKLEKLLNRKLDAKEETKLDAKEESELMNLVQEATYNFMDEWANRVLNEYEQNGLLKAAEKIEGINDYNRTTREALENFLWNNRFAANNILQLTITDKAFYPNPAELQKRLAELHAPGIRGNKFATDYKGNRVSDGFYRTVIINDFKRFTASIIANLEEIFERRIAAAPEGEKAGLRALKESLVGPDGRYRKINVTDGQGYSSISSYRKKAFMFGKWSQQAEEIYQKLLSGNYNLQDLEVAFQPLKPFVYGHVQKNMGVDNAPITSLPVPFQAKNSEYLLIMADALMRGENTGRPNLLKVLSDIMEDSAFDGRRRDANGNIIERGEYNGKGIDTIQFASAIKSGNQGSIDINPFMNVANGEKLAYDYLKEQIFQENSNDDLTHYNYNSFVQKTDYDNYALQQEVPRHFKDHEQAEPSQQRMNIPTDLDEWDYTGAVNYYKWTDHNGKEHSMTAKEIRKEWEEVHATNIRESLNNLAKDLKLNSSSRKEMNLALSEILMDEIESSPRYGVDLMLACEVDDETGEFMIPKGDPIQAKRIEQLINSIIKSRVNKQKIAGGPVVQVTNWGASRQLHIRFNARSGGLLMMESEFKPTKDYKSYDEYKRAEQAGIAYYEVFAPASMQKLFDAFKNPDGTINFGAVEKCDPELLKMITGRIPNEDKYSIAHAKIVGFMPALAGEAMMFPYELTEIDDSDFDVDKRYCQRKIIDIVVDYNKIRKSLVNATLAGLRKYKENNPEGYERWSKKKGWGESDKSKAEEQVNMFLDNLEKMKDSDALMASMYQEYQRILQEDFPYKTRYPEEGTTDARNNQIIDMSWAILSNEMTAPKMLNPGGFDLPKKNAYEIAAYKAKKGTVPMEDIQKMSLEELKKLSSTENDLAAFNVIVQFYKQNSAGSNLIGVFAVNKVAHATLEGNGIFIDMKHFCGEDPITIADTRFEDAVELDPTIDDSGAYVGKSVGQGVGASADTAKDPWLDIINVNMSTAGIFCSMMRMGMPWNDVALFMSQDAILSALREFNRKNLENSGTSLDAIISDRLNAISKKYEFTDNSLINSQPISREELHQGLLALSDVSDIDYETFNAHGEKEVHNDRSDREMIDYKVLLAFSKMRSVAKGIRKPTTITRLNSVSAAVGPLIIDNLILDHTLQSFLAKNNNNNTGFFIRTKEGTEVVDTDKIFELHPILKAFSETVDSRNLNSPTNILFRDMPAGSTHFRDEILGRLPKDYNYIAERIYDDRALLSKLSDFYQSYMLVAKGIVNPEEVKNYIDEFPKYFMSKIKGKYLDNALIQAIEPDFSKKTGKTFLNINTTGMLEKDKQKLRMAWAALHKQDPTLSTQLFTYAFFRGGIGFSPKTWMSLVPVYVKENLKVQKNGVELSYVDTFRHFPTERIVLDTLMDQFVRNNWDNSTLAPMRGGEGTHYITNLEKGELYVRDKGDVDALKGVTYMRTKEGDEVVLWKLVGKENENVYDRMYTRVMPLGNNGEYVEMSTVRDLVPMEVTTTVKENTDTNELPQISPIEQDASLVNTPDAVITKTDQAKSLDDFIRAAMKRFGVAKEMASDLIEGWRDKVKNGEKLGKFQQEKIQQLFKDQGVEVSMDKVQEEFRKYC